MKSRRSAAVKNATIGTASQVVKLLGNFIVQTIFVKTLGATYLGANGLFNNLITFLSFAELGIGFAFSFSLYEPLAQKNDAIVSSIMSLYRKVYNFIGCFIFVSGCILAVFVPFLTKNNQGIEHIRFYFILYLMSTVVSYFFTYNRALLIADQCSYIDSLNQLEFSLLKYFGQAISLFLGSYFGYLLSQILGNFLSNVFITKKARKKYPAINEYTDKKVPSAIINKLKQNVVGAISSKIGSIVVNGTDNILISKFLGLSMVGIYSNYSLVISGFNSVLAQILNSVVASFGNLGVVEKNNKAKQLDLFSQFVYYNAMIIFFIALVTFGGFQAFISLWIGQKYQLQIFSVNLIIINFVLAGFRPALYLINSYGLFWGYRYKSIIEAIVNFGISWVLVYNYNLGLNGVLLGTISSNIIINSWWDPLILFSGVYKKGYGKFYLKYWIYLFVFIFLLIVENLFVIKDISRVESIWELIFKLIILSLVVGGMLFFLFIKTRGEQDLLQRIKLKIRN